MTRFPLVQSATAHLRKRPARSWRRGGAGGGGGEGDVATCASLRSAAELKLKFKIIFTFDRLLVWVLGVELFDAGL